jgi:hypothetical protein
MEEDLDSSPPTMPDVRWDIRREGRAWVAGEAMARYELTPEKFEMDGGKLFWDESEHVGPVRLRTVPLSHIPSTL